MPYRSIDDPAKLRRLLEASLLLEADLDLSVLLRHIVEEAQSMTNARYGALGVLEENQTRLAEFITVGLTLDEERAIGARPTGKGVLGLLIGDPRPIRLARLGDHPESYGFPAGHPPMHSFLGVPIAARDEIYGILYLTDKVGWSEFTSDDESLVSALAVAAGIAIENARLHARVKEAVIIEERDRLGRDLHDTVIQRLFAIGLLLQSTLGVLPGTVAAEKLQRAIEDIDDTIREVRSTIFELGHDRPDRSVRFRVIELARELSPVVGHDVQVDFDGAIDTAVTSIVADQLLATIREALTNVGRHAQATETSLLLTATPHLCRLEVIDNGAGVPPLGPNSSGLGLGNLRRRAEKLGGHFEIAAGDGGGTVVIWQVPLSR